MIGGVCVECIYSFILVVTPVRNTSTVSLATFIVAALLVVETAVYLFVLWWNRKWFMRREESPSQGAVRDDGSTVDSQVV